MPVLIDILIVLVLLGCLAQGLRRGFLGSAGSIAGLAAGGSAAYAAAPAVGALAQPGVARTVLTLVAALVLVLIGAALGARVGSLVARPLRRTPLRPLDRVLGGGLQLVVGALVVAVVASLAVSFGGPAVARPVAESVVAHRLQSLLPAPVAEAVDGVEADVLAAGAAAGVEPRLDLAPTR